MLGFYPDHPSRSLRDVYFTDVYIGSYFVHSDV